MKKQNIRESKNWVYVGYQFEVLTVTWISNIKWSFFWFEITSMFQIESWQQF